MSIYSYITQLGDRGMTKIGSYLFVASCLLTTTLVTAQDQDSYSTDENNIVIAESQEDTNKFSLGWEERTDKFSVIFNGVNFKDVADFTWNGMIVTDIVNEMINNLQAEIKETQNGFILSINGESNREDGYFGVVLSSGEIVEINVPIIPVPSERKRTPNEMDKYSLATLASNRASSCGEYSDASNPYPCCSNGNRPDGNCTWYVWYRAHQTYRGWGVKLPGWGNANSWCNNAKKAGYTVSSNPRGADQGYSIGCNSSGAGHVAWVWKYDNKYVWVDEQNCCNCAVAGNRIGAKYARSYFKYIYKK